MSVLASIVPRRSQLHRWIVALGVFAGVIAILPIAAAVVSAAFGRGPGATTAFASAPPGNYAVFSSAQESADVVQVIPAAGTGDAITIAEVQHLPGYISRGAVSPDGSKLALVVADGGTQANPVASLSLLDLETGHLERIAGGLSYLQEPVWSPAGDGVVVTRDGENAIQMVQVNIESGDETILDSRRATGVYPVAFDADGRLVSVTIDQRGSTLVRDGEELELLSPGITRDWSLSPDGSQVAFIEVDTSSGVHYLPRTVYVDGGGVSVLAATADEQALGTAWVPGSGPVFGMEPASASGSVLAASTGFDVPLAPSADGAALAVQHWTGASFDEPGSATLDVVSGGGRTTIPGASRFFGWAAR